jgi:hypothetical protein
LAAVKAEIALAAGMLQLAGMVVRAAVVKLIQGIVVVLELRGKAIRAAADQEHHIVAVVAAGRVPQV